MLPIGAVQQTIFPGTERVGIQEVQVRALRKVLAANEVPARSLLKADVQGSELSVLRGAAELLTAFTWIYLEVSFLEFYRGQPLAGEIVAYLAEAGFSIADIAPPQRRHGRTVQVDVLFERIESDGNSSQQAAELAVQ